MGLVSRPRSHGLSPVPMTFDSGRPLQAWELAQHLVEGLALAKNLAGEAALSNNYVYIVVCI